MLKINFNMLNVKVVYYKSILSRFVSDSTRRSYSLSLRQKTLDHYKKRYKKHEHIFYSSYLELQEMCEQRRTDPYKTNNFGQFYNEPNILKADSQISKNWMEDYEYYNGANELGLKHNDGTADPNLHPSNVPCNGCGAILHCNHDRRPGFLPSEIFKGRTEIELKTLICQRCHFLKFYNQAIDVEVAPEAYIETISNIKEKFALAIVIVDLIDFPCSIWPEMSELLGPKRPVFIVGNKVDLIPRDSNSYLKHIKDCLREEILRAGFEQLNIKNISLISAKTGYGIEELITQLQKIWAYKGDVYLLGCTNVGKSSLFNILLKSDYCRPETEDLIPKATTSSWPGTTLRMLKFPIYRPSDFRLYKRVERINSDKFVRDEMEKLRVEHARKLGNTSDAVPVGAVGRTFTKSVDKYDDFSMSRGSQPITTFNERDKAYKMARWVYDTPGVLHPDQITNLLNPQELRELEPKQMISPRAYRLKPGMSLFVAGLSRLDFITSDCENLDWIKIFLFASFNLPTMIVDTDYAADIYCKYHNTPLIRIPMATEDRPSKWPELQCGPKDIVVKGKILRNEFKGRNCSGDITLPSIGWIGLLLPDGYHYTFRAWTPNGRGIYLRTPSLVPYAERLIGKRIQNSLAYNTSKPFTFNNYKKRF